MLKIFALLSHDTQAHTLAPSQHVPIYNKYFIGNFCLQAALNFTSLTQVFKFLQASTAGRHSTLHKKNQQKLHIF